MLTEAVVRAALAEVPYPGLKRDIVALGLVRSISVRNDRVHVSLRVSTAREDLSDRLRQAIGDRLARAGAVRSEIQILAPESQAIARPSPSADRVRMPGVRHVIAVGAGKGGVGKSTVAVHLALALQQAGLRVGVLDADIYGPSVPVLMGIEDGARQVTMTTEHQIRPLKALGLAVVSFGFFLGAKSPAVWRGPLVGKAVKQFARGVVWPELDVLVVDLPPGTGDVVLSLSQTAYVAGAIVVTSPQQVAVADSRRAVAMYQKLNIPVLGLIENMSYFVCPSCRHESDIFGRGGGERLAEELGIAFLGSIPISEPLRRGGDTGVPIMLADPDSPVAAAFVTAAERTAAQVSIQSFRTPVIPLKSVN